MQSINSIMIKKRERERERGDVCTFGKKRSAPTPEGSLSDNNKRKEKKRKKERKRKKEKTSIIETSLDVFSFFGLKRKRKRSKRSREHFFSSIHGVLFFFGSFVLRVDEVCVHQPFFPSSLSLLVFPFLPTSLTFCQECCV